MKKLNKIILVSSFLAVGLSSFVNATDHAWKRGFYVGAAAGASVSNSRLSVDYTPANVATFVRNRSDDLGGAGFMGDLRAGWKTPFSKAGLFGIELFGGASSLQSDSSANIEAPAANSRDSVSLKERYSFGAALKFGYIVQNAVLYLKLGGRFTNWRFNATFTSNGLPTTSGGQRNTLLGFEPGIGFDMKVSERVSINGEALYTFYRTKSFRGPDNTAPFNYSYRPRTARFLLGVTYHFGK